MILLPYFEVEGIKIFKLTKIEEKPQDNKKKRRRKNLEEIINKDSDRVILDLGDQTISPDCYRAVNVLIKLLHQTYKNPEPLRVISSNEYTRFLLKDNSKYFRFYNTQREAIDSFYK